MKKIACIGIITIILLSGFSSFSVSSKKVFTKNDENESEWTVMIYFATDNNLEPCAIKSFLDIASVGSTDQVKFVALLDRVDMYGQLPFDTDYQDNSNYGDWTNTRRGLIEKGDKPYNYADESQDIFEWGKPIGDVNTGDPQILYNFVSWAKNNYPAKKYSLILYNHGNAIYRRYHDSGVIRKPGGLCIDYNWDGNFDNDNKNDFIKTSGELNNALKNIRKNIIGPNPEFLIGFHACMMGFLEVAYEIKEYANFMLSSQNYEYNSTWKYDKIASDLVSNPLMNAKELGQIFISHHPKSVGNTPTPVNLIDLNILKFDDLTNSMDVLIQNIMDNSGEFLPEIVSSMYFKNIVHYPEWSLEPDLSIRYPEVDQRYVDLKWFIDNLKEYNLLNDKSRKIDSSLFEDFELAFNRIVVADNDEEDISNGLSIFLPDQYDSKKILKDCFYTDEYLFLKNSEWDEFLNWYLNLNNLPPANPTVEINIFSDEPYVSCIDDSNSDCYYKFHFEDGFKSDWIGGFNELNHTMKLGSKYRVKAKDDKGLKSCWSPWYNSKGEEVDNNIKNNYGTNKLKRFQGNNLFISIIEKIQENNYRNFLDLFED